ncbi:MAG: orotidine-5'-phosphate decarboxylase [Gammaproteobacteria bacterium]
MPKLTYEQRAKQTEHSLARDLLLLMADKKSNLACSADVTTKEALLTLADAVGPEICVLKTHVDIISDFDESFISELTALSKKHQFYIFEDRKFADIGSTVQAQFSKGIYQIADWAHMVNAHSLPGPGIVQGLQSVAKPNQGLLLLAEMSSKGHLADETYVQKTIEMAIAHKDFVFGFIAQRRLISQPDFIYMTPGVSITQSGDHLGQNYLTPDIVIKERGSDIMIVGRSIYQHQSPKEIAKEYRKLGWDAYLGRLT